jgi:hypothetical protein
MITKELRVYINNLISDENVKDFYSLDETHRKKLAALALHSYQYDVDIALGYNTSVSLAKYILTNDEDEKIEIMNGLLNDIQEKFSYELNEIIKEKIDDINIEKRMEAGFMPYRDRVTGETLWRKLA